MRRHLPDPVPPFIGRTRELEALRDHARRGARLLSLFGAAGTGKTRLAIEFAHRTSEHYPGGVRFASSHGVTDPGDQWNLLARALDVSLGAQSPFESFVAQTRRRPPSLVVLDDFAGSSTQLQRLLHELENVSWVVTGHEPLRLPMEHRLEVAAMTPEDAADLFLDRSGRIGALVSVSDADRVRDIVDSVGCHCHAVELVAGWLATSSLADVQRRMRDEGDASLHRVGEISWAELDPAAQAQLIAVSPFARSFTLEAAEGLSGDRERTLHRLSSAAERGLLLPLSDGRFAWHDVVHNIARAQPSFPSAETRARRQLSDRVEAWARQLDRGELARRKMIDELDEIRAVAFEALDRFDPIRARLLIAMREAWMANGPVGRYCEVLAESIRLGLGDDPLLRGQLLLASATCLRALGTEDAAERALEAAAELLEPEPSLRMQVDIERGVSSQRAGDLESARFHYERALAAAGRDIAFAARVTGNLGTLAHAMGEFDEALAHYDAALSGFRRSGMTRLEIIFLHNMGLLRQELGAIDDAAEDYSIALGLLEHSPDPHFEASARTSRGLLFLALDRLSDALEDQQIAVRRFAELGAGREQGLASIRLAVTQALVGERSKVRRSLESAERILGPLEDPLALEFVELARAFLDLQLAAAAREVDEPDDARYHLELAGQRLARALDPSSNGEALLDAFYEARIVASLLRTRLEALSADDGGEALVVTADAQRFRPPGGSWKDFGRKQSAKRILAALVSRHGRGEEGALSVSDLFEIGWDNQKIQSDSKSNRVYVAIADLRKRGLSDVLLRCDDGYYLDPNVSVIEVER